jgi:hypothetical protein
MKSARDGEKPAMNPNNYASLAASKRLVEAGIVLKTEVVWATDGLDWVLMSRDRCGSWMQGIPAPSMAEVWRELPYQEHTVRYGAYLEMSKIVGIDIGEQTYVAYMRDGIASCDYANRNPTDALIDLLIWVRKEKP